MNPLPKYPGNVSLICKVQFIKTSDLQTIIKTGSSLAAIVHQVDKPFADIYATPSSIQFVEKTEITDAGRLFRKELHLSFPGADQAVQDAFAELDGHPLVVVFYYQNDDIRMLGDLQEPAFFTADFETSDKNGYQVIFKTTSIERTRFVTSITDTTPE